MSKKKTGWFKGVKPKRNGVYETEHGFQRFENRKWYGYCGYPEEAAETDYISAYQNPKWRGFTTEQK